MSGRPRLPLLQPKHVLVLRAVVSGARAGHVPTIRAIARELSRELPYSPKSTETVRSCLRDLAALGLFEKAPLSPAVMSAAGAVLHGFEYPPEGAPVLWVVRPFRADGPASPEIFPHNVTRPGYIPSHATRDGNQG